MGQQIVTIVGRTNVGKSTLFNKLVGKRKAITEDTEGVTRDRVYDKVDWTGHQFILSDTGGLDFSNKEVMNEEIKNQAIRALNESNLILFVVDGKNGLSSHDFDIANEIRKFHKPVILVINKVDTPKLPDDIYDFYQLGFDNIEVISAEHSRGLGDLLDKIIENIDFSEEVDQPEATRISIIGKPNAGKSSLVNYFLDENRMIVTNVAGTTRDAVDTFRTYKDRAYVLIDTAGLRKRKKVTENVEYYANQRTLDAVDSSEICLIIIDATVGVTEQDTKIAGYAHDNKKAIIIVVNKRDLIKKNNKTQKEFEMDVRQSLSFLAYAPIVFISALTGKGVRKLLDTVELVDNNYNMRIPTGNLNSILAEAVMLNPTPQDKGKRLKIYYISQVQTAPPKFIMSVNDVNLMHFSYQRYLENQIRERYSLIGVPFTFEIKGRKQK